AVLEIDSLERGVSLAQHPFDAQSLPRAPRVVNQQRQHEYDTSGDGQSSQCYVVHTTRSGNLPDGTTVTLSRDAGIMASDRATRGGMVPPIFHRRNCQN